VSGSPRSCPPGAATLALVAGLWLAPVHEELTAPAWHLFALFLGSIVAVVAGVLPILTSSVLAVGAAVLTGTLTPAGAYAGFANGTILLIIVAFLVARAVVKCGLGERLGYVVVILFGKSTLGLGYSVFLLDAVIAPAFPSNTARGGVLYPVVYSLARGGGSQSDEATRKRMGAYLMFCGMASLTVSSALWLTAMAANPLGAETSRVQGLENGFGSWLAESSVPTLLCLALLPLLLYKVFPPDVTATPVAPDEARAALKKLGPFGASEKVVAGTFFAMVVAWGLAGTLKLDSTAIAFAGLGVPAAPLAFALLFATNYFSVLTPQGSSANLLFAGSGYLTQGELYRLGAITTVFSFLVYAVAGTPWVLLVAR
jgi:DASS family divalent anion:Na+ symporter